MDVVVQMLVWVGFNVISICEVIKLVEVLLGFIYYYFFGGKQELLVCVIYMVGDKVEVLLMELLEGGVVQGLQQFLVIWCECLLCLEFSVGCLVLVVVVEELVEVVFS